MDDSDDTKHPNKRRTLRDEDIQTRPKVSRRSLLVTGAVAVPAILGGCQTIARPGGGGYTGLTDADTGP